MYFDAIAKTVAERTGCDVSVRITLGEQIR